MISVEGCALNGIFEMNPIHLVKHLHLDLSQHGSLLKAILVLEAFLSQVEAELFKLSGSSIRYSNLSKDEWDAIGSPADDRRIVIKRADKGSCVVIWDRNDYLLEVEKQLKDKMFIVMYSIMSMFSRI